MWLFCYIYFGIFFSTIFLQFLLSDVDAITIYVSHYHVLSILCDLTERTFLICEETFCLFAKCYIFYDIGWIKEEIFRPGKDKISDYN